MALTLKSYLSQLSSVFNNSAFNFIIQLLNFLFPIFLIRHLISTLGVDAYAFYVIGISISTFLVIINDFGISVWAVATISGKKDANEIKSLMASLVSLKIFLFLITLSGVIIYVFVSGIEQVSLSLLFLLIILGKSLQPVWYFQAVEKVSMFAIITLLCQFIFFVVVLNYISTEGDLYKLIVLNGITQIIIVILSFILISRANHLKFKSSCKEILQLMKILKNFFFSRIATSAYQNFNLVILNIFSTPQVVVIFSVAEQIYGASRLLIGSIGNAFLPYMVKNKNLKIYSISLVFLACLVAMYCALIYLFNIEIITFLLKKIDFMAIDILTIFLACIFFNGLSTFVGYPLYLAYGDSKTPNDSLIFGSYIYLFIITIMIFTIGISAYKLAFLLLGVELMVFLFRIMNIKRILSS